MEQPETLNAGSLDALVSRPATDRQIAWLESRCIWFPTPLSMQEASDLITEHQQRHDCDNDTHPHDIEG